MEYLEGITQPGKGTIPPLGQYTHMSWYATQIDLANICDLAQAACNKLTQEIAQ
jgi:hypothetical protein